MVDPVQRKSNGKSLKKTKVKNVQRKHAINSLKQRKVNHHHIKVKNFPPKHAEKCPKPRKVNRRGNKGMPLAEDTKQKISQTMKGRPSPCGFKSKNHSNQTCRQISEKLMSQERKDAREYYFNLPKSMSIKEKRKKISEFTGKTPSKIWHWTKAWENGKE